MAKRWYLSDPVMGTPAHDVDFDAGVIRGAAIATVGPAKGHGVQLNENFINEVVAKGNDQGKGGIKVRFGHPTMCGNALLDSPFIGRAKNFSQDGNIARADIFLSQSARETPAGDLYTRTLNLAAEDPDMFGTSIVFTPGDTFHVGEDGEKVYSGDPGFTSFDGEPFIEIEKLHGADIVDEPAANNGLFSALHADTFAAQVTEFLDTNPKLWELLKECPEVVAEFTARYERYSERKQEIETMEDVQQNVETHESGEVVDVVETETTETFAAEPAEVVEVEAQPVDFHTLYQAYGGAFAEYAYSEKLTADEAKDAYMAHLQDRLTDTEAQLAAAQVGEDEAAAFEAVDEDADAEKRQFNAKVKSYAGKQPDGVAKFAAKIQLPE